MLRLEALVPAAAVVVFLPVFGVLGGADDPARPARWTAPG